MRISVECRPGDLASDPGSALSGLCDLAAKDGAESDWLEKAVASAGATKLSVEVSKEPPYAVIDEAVRESLAVFDHVMVLMDSAIRELLIQAAADADVSTLREE